MAAKPIPAEQLPVTSKPLHVPKLEEAATVIEKCLRDNFDCATVKVADCPDLTQEPTRIAAEGLCGQARLLDIGGVPYLVPIPKRDKVYDIREFPKLTDMAGGPCLVIGAGAGPYAFIDRNSEMMPNLLLDKDGSVIEQKSTIARTFDENNSSKLIALPKEETSMNLMGNLFISRGNPGKVLEIRCRKRKGQENFVSCIRKSLASGFPDKPVGLGGVFTVTEGKVKTHVMPAFSKKPLNTPEEVDQWLKFYEMDAPFTCLSFLISIDPGLDVRMEHSHGYCRAQEQGGHYHCDTTPDIVEYLAYFNIAEYIYRVDQPKDQPRFNIDNQIKIDQGS